MNVHSAVLPPAPAVLSLVAKVLPVIGSGDLMDPFLEHCPDIPCHNQNQNNLFSLFQTQETSAKTKSGRCRKGHLEKIKSIHIVCKNHSNESIS